jgi:two-component sensor histidine kinase
VNELVQNALEHAFVGRERGRVSIALQQAPDMLTVQVQDDGVGLAEESPRQLGLELIETLVCEDLSGTWSLVGEDGTTATIRVPL